MRITKTHMSESKPTAIRHACEKKNIDATARKLDIASNLLSPWIRQRDAQVQPGKGNVIFI